MSYNYQTQRSEIFTEEGQVMFLKIRDTAQRLLASAGACKSGNLMASTSGDTWTMMACIDRLVELGEIVEVTGPNVRGQDRVFVRKR